MSIPSVYFIGASKCASTTLYNIFKNHCNEVYCSDKKENRFFIKDYHKGVKELAKIYPNPCDKIILDFQPNNCLYSWAAERIGEVCNDPKIILVIRNPVARAYSEICHFKKMRPGRLIGTPDEIIEQNFNTFSDNKFPDEYSYIKQCDPVGGNYEHTFLEMGCYINHYNRYKQFKMKIIIFEDFVLNHQLVIDDICSFIGIDKFKVVAIDKSNSKTDNLYFNSSSIMKLNRFYRKYNHDMSELLGVNLKEWWK